MGFIVLVSSRRYTASQHGKGRNICHTLEVFVLLLEQEDQSLEDHTRLFLLVPPAARNDALCAFFDASPPMTENHFPPRSASQRKVERLSGGSSRKLSPTVRSGARAGDIAHHEEASYGRCERGVDLHPLHRG